jgi:hypothetical protein
MAITLKHFADGPSGTRCHCGDQFDSIELMLQHLATVGFASIMEHAGFDLASGPDRTVWRCLDCGYTSEDLVDVAAHIKQHGWRRVDIDQRGRHA